VSDVTGMKALTSILLMNVIQIVIWMYEVMMSLKHAGLIDAIATQRDPDGNDVAKATKRED
jgi:hypothetical protein